MIRALLSIYKLLDKNQKKKFFFLQVLVITTALLEVGSLFLVGQFMFLLTDTKNLHSKEHFTFLYNFFNFSNDQDFFIIFSVITLIFFIITTIILLIIILISSIVFSIINSEYLFIVLMALPAIISGVFLYYNYPKY